MARPQSPRLTNYLVVGIIRSNARSVVWIVVLRQGQQLFAVFIAFRSYRRLHFATQVTEVSSDSIFVVVVVVVVVLLFVVVVVKLFAYSG